jgi:hypothetical protein
VVDYSYMAYLDILGYKELLESDLRNGNQFFKEKMISAFKVFDEINSTVYSRKVISDSIFINCSNRDAVDEFISLISSVFCSFLEVGLVIRGGVSYGQHFQNETITYSPVLTKAYLLESKAALFPRVMVDRNIYEMFPALLQDKKILLSGQNFFINVIAGRDPQNIWECAKRLFYSDTNAVLLNESVRIKHKWLQDYLHEYSASAGVDLGEKYLKTFDSPISLKKADSGVAPAEVPLA